MTRPLLIRGGRLIDPATAFDGPSDILLAAGRVAARGRDLPAGDAEVIEVRGAVVAPGFVDLHTHLRFPGFPEKETIESGTAAAAAGGFTTVCAMANTSPVVDSVEVLQMVEAEVARAGQVRVRQLAAVTHGLAGERLTDMAALARAGAVAFSDDGKPVAGAALMRAALEKGARLGLPISVHEEDPDVVRGGVANGGERARRWGLSEWPCAGEAAMLARDIALLRETGGHLHVAHVSCAATVELLRKARVEGLPVTAEVTPHHLRLTDDLLDGAPDWGLPPAHPCTKVNPPLRTPGDVDALVDALADGTIQAVATDHAPHAAPDKDRPYSEAAFGISGIETALPLVLDLVRDGRLTLSAALDRLTAGPARIFNLDAGSLAVGAPADLCVFDPDSTWRLTPERMRSRGKNTPLSGATVRGRVLLTVVGGQVAHRDL